MADGGYNKAEAARVQKEYAEEKGVPHFAPKGGKCWKCGRNIYEPWTRTEIDPFGKEKEVTTGITVGEAATKLITGCPHCNWSYCS